MATHLETEDTSLLARASTQRRGNGANAKTVLIAEDSVVQAEMLRRGLENAGYEVIEARDGAQALEFAATRRPGALVSDIRMPGLDGYELCRAIRRDEALNALPVILLTELSDPLDVIRGLEAGADAYVTKPYDYPTLVARIESLTAFPLPRVPTHDRQRATVRVLGDAHKVDADGPRVLNLLISTYENAVLQNRQLVAAQDALEHLNATLENELRQSQKMEALGTLAGGITHDFNNILTAISGHAVLAANAAQPLVAEESFTEIHRALVRAKELTNRILLFSRRQKSERRLVAVPVVIDEALTLLRATLARHITIRTTYARDLPFTLADASQIHQVMVNLGTNAAHAIGDTCGTLSVEVDAVWIDAQKTPTVDLKSGRYVRITVADTGHGISPDAIPRIFDPFFTTKGDAGTGLGLAVVQGIVREHGGAILAHSEPGRGARFDVFLPAVTADLSRTDCTDLPTDQRRVHA